MTTSQPPTVAWTASRCNRTLRQLNTLLTRLEKYWEDYESERRTSKSARPSLSKTKEGVEGSVKDATRDAEDGWETDNETPEWMSKSRGSRSLKTYANRKKQEEGQDLNTPPVFPQTPVVPRSQPGQISIATPFITGSVDTMLARRYSPHKFTTNGGKSSGRISIPGWKVDAQRRAQAAVNVGRSSNGSFEVVNDPRYCTITSRLKQVVENFLVSTRDPIQSPKEATSTEVSSLFAMCQRALPSYIMDEQAMFDAQKGTDEPIESAYSQMFNELEDAYGSSTNGYTPLREICRAYGIRILCDAIERGFLHWHQVTEEILGYEFISDHTDAMQAVAFATLTVQEPLDRPGTVDANMWSIAVSPILHALSLHMAKWMHQNMRDRLVHWHPGTNTFRFRVLNYLLCQGIVCIEWVALDVMTMKDAIESVSSNDQHSWAAIQLLETVFLMATGLPQLLTSSNISNLRQQYLNAQAVEPCPNDVDTNDESPAEKMEELMDNLTESLLAIATSVVIVRRDSPRVEQRADSKSSHQFLGGLSTILQQETELYADHKLSRTKCRRLDNVWLANILSCRTGPDQPLDSTFLTNFGLFVREFDSLFGQQDVVRSMATFIRPLSDNCGRARGENHATGYFESFSELTKSLVALHLPSFPAQQLLCYAAASEAAMKFANDRPGRSKKEHFDLAYYCQENLRVFVSEHEEQLQGADTDPTPRLPPSYAWEDTMGEWIAKTPASDITSKRPIEMTEEAMAVLHVNDRDLTSSPDLPNIPESASKPGPISTDIGRPTPEPSSPIQIPRKRRQARMKLASQDPPTVSRPAKVDTSKRMQNTRAEHSSSDTASEQNDVDVTSIPKKRSLPVAVEEIRSQKIKRSKPTTGPIQPYVDSNEGEDDEDELSFVSEHSGVLRSVSGGANKVVKHKAEALQSPDCSDDELGL